MIWLLKTEMNVHGMRVHACVLVCVISCFAMSLIYSQIWFRGTFRYTCMNLVIEL